MTETEETPQEHLRNAMQCLLLVSLPITDVPGLPVGWVAVRRVDRSVLLDNVRQARVRLERALKAMGEEEEVV